MAESFYNQDFSLRQFLMLMQWLHVVLVQDCALLYAQHPHFPIFCFEPFTFSSFTAFSANAVALVADAEEKVRLAFHSLPEHMAWSMHGYATDLQMKQELNHSKLQDQLQDLQRQTAHLALLIGNSKGSKARIPGELFSLIQLLSPCKMTDTSHLLPVIQSCHHHPLFPPQLYCHHQGLVAIS